MARVFAIDYGTKKIGLAVTDSLQITVNGLETQSAESFWPFFIKYMCDHEVETVVIGYPEHADGSPTHLAPHIKGLKRKISKNYPPLRVVLHPEDYTSQKAKGILLKSGIGRKKRRDKQRIDRLSAILILQDYLGHLEDTNL